LELRRRDVEARVPLVLIVTGDAVVAEDQEAAPPPSAVAQVSGETDTLRQGERGALQRSDHAASSKQAMFLTRKRARPPPGPGPAPGPDPGPGSEPGPGPGPEPDPGPGPGPDPSRWHGSGMSRADRCLIRPCSTSVPC